MTAPYRWRGHIRRSNDGIVGALADGLGFEIALTGQKVGDRYAVVGVPGPMPEWFVLPGDPVAEGYEPWP